MNKITLEKAIEIKTLCNPSPSNATVADWIIADHISIEALRRMRTLRAEPYLSAHALLPSETEF